MGENYGTTRAQRLRALPTWLLTRFLILPFVKKTHAWYGRTFTLADWTAGQKPILVEMDWCLWVSFACMIAFFFIIP